MNRLDRALGILLLLRAGTGITAAALAQRFEVSPRTIYRDVATLSALGVPVYAERGRGGGIRLLEGYFLPPVTFTRSEALALILGLALLRSLRAKPFAADLETAAHKLVAALPAFLRPALRAVDQHFGFEILHTDVFHPAAASEQAAEHRLRPNGAAAAASRDVETESAAVTTFVQGIVAQTKVVMRYRSPYRSGPPQAITVTPLGAFWDRGYWYLVGSPEADNVAEAKPRMWRADRVLGMRETTDERDLRELAGERWEHQTIAPVGDTHEFDIAIYLGRRWLREAMERWAGEAPVRIQLTRELAERLQADWYYQHARFEPSEEGGFVMTFGETDAGTVLELLRWLGPEAELLEPAAWRARLAYQLKTMLRTYETDG